jgi:hypothetical protein
MAVAMQPSTIGTGFDWIFATPSSDTVGDWTVAPTWGAAGAVFPAAYAPNTPYNVANGYIPFLTGAGPSANGYVWAADGVTGFLGEAYQNGSFPGGVTPISSGATQEYVQIGGQQQWVPIAAADPLRPPPATGMMTTSDSSPHIFTALTGALSSIANTEVSVVVEATDGTDAATFYLHGSYLNVSGTITLLTYVNSPNNSAATSGAGAWTASLTVSGTTITVVIQGAGTNVKWTGESQLTYGYAP